MNLSYNYTLYYIQNHYMTILPVCILNYTTHELSFNYKYMFSKLTNTPLINNFITLHNIKLRPRYLILQEASISDDIHQ